MAEHISFILLAEPMFVLVCLASLPGTPRRALDAAGLVLVWCGFLQWQWQCNSKQTGVDNDYCKRGPVAWECGVITFAAIPIFKDGKLQTNST
jgi:hypothetical protein